MRNYQRTKSNPYLLPHNVYMICLYLVRDYERIKSEMDDILHTYPSSQPDGLPHGTDITDTTAKRAIKLEELSKKCEIIEQAIIIVPCEYRKGILKNINYNYPYPITAHRNTYGYWKSKFLYQIAYNSNLI